MMTFDQVAAALAQEHTNSGGTDAQKAAAASLWFGLLHYELVELARALRRRDVEASVHPVTLGFALRVGRDELEVTRGGAHRPDTIRFEWRGFGVPYLDNVKYMPCEHAAVEQIAADVKEFVGRLGELISSTARS